nr:cytochrome c heme lyase subunit CcmF [Raoultella sp. NCTC 9187]
MMPELGNYLLCLAAGLALLLSVYPLWGASRQDRRMMALARPLACALFFCIVGAFLVLVHAFVVNDFTVRYVAETPTARCRCGIGWPRPGAPTRALCCCGCCC